MPSPRHISWIALLAGCTGHALADPAATGAPPASTASAPAPPPAPPPAPAPLPPPSASPHRFLVIGDSHVFGPMGAALDEALRKAPGRRVWTYGSCGSSPLTWIKGMETPCGGYEHPDGLPISKQPGAYRTPALRDLLGAVHPDTTIVMMGTNFLCCSATEGPYIQKLIDVIEASHSRCVWVGPPEARQRPGAPVPPGPPPTERLYRVLEKETASRCLLLDARKLGVKIQDPMDDIHVGPATAAVWSARVAEAVEERLGAERR